MPSSPYNIPITYIRLISYQLITPNIAPTKYLLKKGDLFMNFSFNSAPYLVNFVAEIALYPPTTLMRRIAVLCLTIVASCKIIFYFLFDKSVARDLFQRNNHVLVPWR